MTPSRRRRSRLIASGSLVLAVVFWLAPAQADPSKYPAFAQQKLPEDIKPAMIGIEELVKELNSRRQAGDRRCADAGRVSRGAYFERGVRAAVGI